MVKDDSEDDENHYVVFMPPTETQFAESDHDSDAGAEGDSAHLPRRVLRSSGELSSISDKPEATRNPYQQDQSPEKNEFKKRKMRQLFCSKTRSQKDC